MSNWILKRVNIFFCTYYNIANKHKKYSKIKFRIDDLSLINIVIHQIFSLISLVLSETVQDKYEFSRNKSLNIARFPNCKSLKSTASLALHWKRFILQTCQYITYILQYIKHSVWSCFYFPRLFKTDIVFGKAPMTQ